MNNQYIKHNVSLKDLNTFRINSNAKYYFDFYEDIELTDFVSNCNLLKEKILVLGSGSNLLFVNDFDGLIIHPKTKGINIISETDEYVEVKVAAGEVWDDFVVWAVENNYYGIENLSLIPGTVGASAVQNIGAYGVEVADTIVCVKYLDITDGEISRFTNKQCKFEYRNSVFKKSLKNRIVILSVNFKLLKNAQLNDDYGDVRSNLEKYDNQDLKAMREVIVNIRNSKLPDPDIIGNAGSFFKNPIVDRYTLTRLKKDFSEIKFYAESSNQYKIAAGWLIDACGLKSFEHKGAAIHDKQALVVVNKNNATGKDILELSKIVQQKVFDKFGVMLEPEVNIIL